MRTAPEPKYEYRVEELVKLYKKAIAELQRELNRYDMFDTRAANTRAILAEVSRILSELNEESALWVEKNVPAVAHEGVARTLYELGVVSTLEQAKKIESFNKLNERAVAAAVADMQTDLLAVTQNIDRRVRNAVRQVTADVLRSNMVRGINGRKTITRELAQNLRKRLGESLETGIIDAAGRRWKPETYVDTLARTKLMDVHHEAKINEAVSREAWYGLISTAPAKDACRFHTGRIIKLVAEAPGPYVTYEELRASNQIFHPRCVHTFTTISNLERLPEKVRVDAEKKAEEGDKALATGKRNPNTESIGNVKLNKQNVKLKPEDVKALENVDDLIRDLNISDRRKMAKSLLEKINLTDAKVKIAKIKSNGYVRSALSDGKIKVIEYALQKEDGRPKHYQLKTVLHEFYHANMNGLRAPTKMRIGSNLWTKYEETATELSSIAMLKRMGYTSELVPSYPAYLVEMLPKLKRTDEFSGCSKLEDFGELMLKYRFHPKYATSDWTALREEVEKAVGKFDEKAYAKQYKDYVAKNIEEITEMLFESVTDINKHNRKDTYIKAIRNSIERGWEIYSDVGGPGFSQSLLIAMMRMGVK